VSINIVSSAGKNRPEQKKNPITTIPSTSNANFLTICPYLYAKYIQAGFALSVLLATLCKVDTISHHFQSRKLCGAQVNEKAFPCHKFQS
jgi:hypothetical protein